MPTRDARPTVLLADDHRHVLEAVSGLLDTDFELVAAVADGQRALESTRRLDPDVVVLDITMPGLNGFQVAAELKRTGSRARIVFLSMHSADDYVATAITSGADGYVLKTRIQPDLIRALHLCSPAGSTCRPWPRCQRRRPAVAGMRSISMRTIRRIWMKPPDSSGRRSGAASRF
jgi:DNA-binding NarL/FixJ family response regulator